MRHITGPLRREFTRRMWLTNLSDIGAVMQETFAYHVVALYFQWKVYALYSDMKLMAMQCKKY